MPCCGVQLTFTIKQAGGKDVPPDDVSITDHRFRCTVCSAPVMLTIHGASFQVKEG